MLHTLAHSSENTHTHTHTKSTTAENICSPQITWYYISSKNHTSETICCCFISWGNHTVSVGGYYGV